MSDDFNDMLVLGFDDDYVPHSDAANTERSPVVGVETVPLSPADVIKQKIDDIKFVIVAKIIDITNCESPRDQMIRLREIISQRPEIDNLVSELEMLKKKKV